jgi:hypothetical protein
MKVICVIADIVQSRAIENRRVFQRGLDRTLRKLNAGHKHLLSPYTITLGDEFQAVYQSADDMFRDFSFIQLALHPHKARFAVGVAELATPINPRRAIGMDGPAFYLARTGINELKQSSSLFRILFKNSEGRTWINPALELVSHLEAGWTKNRFHILHRLFPGRDVKAIARELKLTPAAVYKNIQAGALNTIVQLDEEICGSINAGLIEK